MSRFTHLQGSHRGIQERGFTLIELVMVIVILGVLSAVALPKFVDLSADAQIAATQSVAGALTSASAINYAARKVDATKGSPITTCAGASVLLSGGVLPTGYNLGTVPLAIGVNSTVNCPLFGPKSTTGTAWITGIL